MATVFSITTNPLFSQEAGKRKHFARLIIQNSTTGEFVSIIPNLGGAVEQIGLCCPSNNTVFHLLEGMLFCLVRISSPH